VTDHVTQTEVNQSEVDQLNAALNNATASQSRGFGDSASKASPLTDLLASIPGTGGLIQEAIDLQRASDAQTAENDRAEQSRGMDNAYVPYDGNFNQSRADPGANNFAAPPGSQGGPPGPGFPGVTGMAANIDPQAAVAKIYPILAFRDKVVRSISAIVSKIPGLERMIDTISEKVTLFVLGLLAPFVKPIIAAASNALKTGSGTVVDASAKQQYLVWTDPSSTDPTHSMLSKDHFSNVLNSPAGQLAGAMLKYVAPRVVYGWDHPEVPENDILNDIGRCFHHPAIRDNNLEIHRTMFSVVEKWAHSRPIDGKDLNNVLSSDSVRAGKNHIVANLQQSFKPLSQDIQSGFAPLTSNLQSFIGGGTSSHSHTAGGVFNMLSGFTSSRELGPEDFASPQQGQSSSAYGGGPSQSYANQGYENQSYGQQQQQQQHGYGGGEYGQQQGGYEQQGGYQQGGYQQGGGYPGNNEQQGYPGSDGYGRY
jgi:hypothetical protein